MRGRYDAEEADPGRSMGIKKTAKRLVPAAIAIQIRMVERKPKRSSNCCIRKGQADPVIFLQERTTPYARALLLVEKYSLSDKVVGLYTKTHPKAVKIPCETTRCQALVLKEEAKKPAHASATPQKAAVRRRCAHRRLNAAKSRGMERYITPFEVVPTTPTILWLPLNDQCS